MATPLEIDFSTDEKVVAQAEVKLIGSTVESITIEWPREVEKLLSSGSTRPKSMRKFRKVSNETRSLTSPDVFQGQASSEKIRTSSDKAHNSSSLEANTACDQACYGSRSTQSYYIPRQRSFLSPSFG